MLNDIIIPAFTILFVAIDPIAIAPLFAALVQDYDKAHQRKLAMQSVVVGSIILALFALFGERLLGILGISMAAFRAAGGVLLFLLALEMVFEKRTSRRRRKTEKAQSEQHGDDIAVFPMGIPLIAGPGAITSVVLLMTEQSDNPAGQLAVGGVVLAIMVITLVLLLASGPITRAMGTSFTSAFTRVLGVILAAMATQFIFDGVSAGFAG